MLSHGLATTDFVMLGTEICRHRARNDELGPPWHPCGDGGQSCRCARCSRVFRHSLHRTHIQRVLHVGKALQTEPLSSSCFDKRDGSKGALLRAISELLSALDRHQITQIMCKPAPLVVLLQRRAAAAAAKAAAEEPAPPPAAKRPKKKTTRRSAATDSATDGDARQQTAVQERQDGERAFYLMKVAAWEHFRPDGGMLVDVLLHDQRACSCAPKMCSAKQC